MKKIVRMVFASDAISDDAMQTLGATPVETATIPTADFTIDPQKCKTKLGQWLAENISSTVRDDDGARLALVMPFTNSGLMLSNLGKAMAGQTYMKNHRVFPPLPGSMISSQAEFDDAIRVIRASLTAIETQVATNGPLVEFTPVKYSYKWPVFGSKVGGWPNVRTAESFFDFCADDLAESVVLSAGSTKAEPPLELIKPMCKGRGLYLLDMYKSALSG
jgi:hypothetical protein